jgi:hypothetical protein
VANCLLIREAFLRGIRTGCRAGRVAILTGETLFSLGSFPRLNALGDHVTCYRRVRWNSLRCDAGHCSLCATTS